MNRAEAQDPEWGERRKRFTICHELGHWVLHRDGQQALFCRHASVEENGPQAKAERPPLPGSGQTCGATWPRSGNSLPLNLDSATTVQQPERL